MGTKLTKDEISRKEVTKRSNELINLANIAYFINL